MLTQLAALGIGLITAIGTPAVAQADCGPSSPAAAHPTYGAPGYGPVYAPAPRYTPAPPHAQPRYPEPSRAVVLRRADFDRDGGITFAEAQAYGRSEFRRADDDRNGILTPRELRDRHDELARGARSRDGVVTFAEYDASMRRQFAALDRNRDGYLSRHELGNGGAPSAASWSWHWRL